MCARNTGPAPQRCWDRRGVTGSQNLKLLYAECARVVADNQPRRRVVTANLTRMASRKTQATSALAAIEKATGVMFRQSDKLDNTAQANRSSLTDVGYDVIKETVEILRRQADLINLHANRLHDLAGARRLADAAKTTVSALALGFGLYADTITIGNARANEIAAELAADFAETEQVLEECLAASYDLQQLETMSLFNDLEQAATDSGADRTLVVRLRAALERDDWRVSHETVRYLQKDLTPIPYGGRDLSPEQLRANTLHNASTALQLQSG